MDEWKHEYATSRLVSAYLAKGQTHAVVLHHVHPAVPGRAHCNFQIRLDMDNVKSEPPVDVHYCNNCRNHQLNWTRIHHKGEGHAGDD